MFFYVPAPDIYFEARDIELRRASDTADTHSLNSKCLKCGRMNRVDYREFVQRCGIDVNLWEVTHKARCGACQRKNVRLLLYKKGVNGDRAWVPSPPWVGRD